MSLLFFFFFQAEDGIRDGTVTGVQTCALPISPETREPRPDGTTVYSRPLPGKARMYPETDVPPIRVTRERLDRIREHLPERPDVTEARLAREYAIHEQQA